MVIGGAKTPTIKDGSETNSPHQLPDYCSVSPSSGFTASSNGEELKQHSSVNKSSLLQNREGRRDKQRKSDGQPECCERGVCCSFMMYEKCILFALHLFRRECDCVPHYLDRLFPLTQNEILFVSQCSGPILCYR